MFCAGSYCHCPLPPCPPFFSTLNALGCPHSVVSPASEACRETSLQMLIVSFYHMGPRERTPMVKLRSKYLYQLNCLISLAPVENHLPCFGKQSECRLQIKMPNKGCRNSLTPDVQGPHLSEQEAKHQDVPHLLQPRLRALSAVCANALPIGLSWLTPPTSVEKERGQMEVSTPPVLPPFFMA